MNVTRNAHGRTYVLVITRNLTEVWELLKNQRA
jgi:hypothetical protein